MRRLDDHQDQAGAWLVLAQATGRMAFDVGANVGQSTRVLARNFDHVVAFEPCQESFEILAIEAEEHVTPVCAAVSARDGEIALDEAAMSIATGQLVTGPGLALWGERVGRRTVPAVTLDSMTEHFGYPDFLKVDVEGHEVEVLRGAQKLLCASHPEVIVEIHQEDNEAPVRALLAGYDLVKLTHGDYVRPGGEIHRNHFWLSSVAPKEEA